MKLAVYGYDSIVGKLVLEQLEDSALPLENFFPLSPLPQEFDAVPLRGKNYPITYIEEFDFAQADVVLLLTPQDISATVVPKAQSAGCIVIDNSHLYSGQQDTPVVLAELNPYVVSKVLEKKLATVPLATSSEIVLALHPLHDEYGLKQVVVTALLSASEQGELGTQTLAKETTRLLNGLDVEVIDFPAQIAFNVLNRIGAVDEAGISAHEKMVTHEVKALLDDLGDKFSLTCLQVPTFYGQIGRAHV